MVFSSTAPPPPASGWAGLQRDVLWTVFTALGQREILAGGAGIACAPWWRLARHEPGFWRRIDLTAPDNDRGAGDSTGWKAMALAAVDRSAGKCEAFWGRADDEVLLYLADRASSLKSLHVTSHYNDVSSEVFAELIKKFPLLEELELVLKYEAIYTKSEQPSTNSWVKLLESTCKACCHLRQFTVRGAGNKQPFSFYRGEQKGSIPFSIPMMHILHSVELSGDSFTKDVVMQIVDKCPSLESLNISDVSYEDRWGDKLLDNKCYRIKYLRFPALCFYDSDSYDYPDFEIS